jgi:hypothetical protein
MAHTTTGAQEVLWDEQMRRWNEWQRRVGESPAEYLDLPLQQALDFRMSHLLFSADALVWMEKKLDEKGLAAIHALRLPELEPKKDHHVAIFRVGVDCYAILEGHHRLVAACLLAYRQAGSQWQTSIRFRVHNTDAETVRLWRTSIPEMDGQMLARFPTLRGASDAAGTIREFLADGQWTPSSTVPITTARAEE